MHTGYNWPKYPERHKGKREGRSVRLVMAHLVLQAVESLIALYPSRGLCKEAV